MHLTLTLPWPPANISPNAKRRLHWTQYTGTVHGYRRACHVITREAMGRVIFGAVKAVSITFAPPDARGRDDDNMIGAFKPGRDGIAAALGRDDKTWKGRVAYHFAQVHSSCYGKVAVLNGAYSHLPRSLFYFGHTTRSIALTSATDKVSYSLIQ